MIVTIPLRNFVLPPYPHWVHLDLWTGRRVTIDREEWRQDLMNLAVFTGRRLLCVFDSVPINGRGSFCSLYLAYFEVEE